MTQTNKHGQALGRKGLESRQRLLDATLALIVTEPPHKLSVRAISRAAGMPSQSFYRYFGDIEEVLLELAQAAGNAMQDVHAALAVNWESDTPAEHGKRFVETFGAYWNRHRSILSVRNYLSDGGHPEFLTVRQAAALPIIRSIALRMMKANADTIGETEAFARSVIVYSAIERVASRPATMRHNPEMLSTEQLQRAEIDILTLLFTPNQLRLDARSVTTKGKTTAPS